MLYSFNNPHVTAMVLDSPFSNFLKVADEMVGEYKIVPKFLRDYLFDLTAQHIKKVSNFDIKTLIPKKYIRNCKIPTIFIHSNEDKLVKIDHSRELYAEFKGPKCFIEITGEHNSVRDRGVVMKTLKIVQFLIIKCQSDDQEMVTSREQLPEFQPNLAEVIRHRRGFSQGDIN